MEASTERTDAERLAFEEEEAAYQAKKRLEAAETDDQRAKSVLGHPGQGVASARCVFSRNIRFQPISGMTGLASSVCADITCASATPVSE